VPNEQSLLQFGYLKSVSP